MSDSRQLSTLGYYHVVNRGAGRQLIFFEPQDYCYFYERLCRIDCDELRVVAWCLMNNHFHILLHGNLALLSEKLRILQAAYTKHFNLAHGHTGPIFEGRFKSESIGEVEYLLQTVCYIHQNPVKANIGGLESYTWSSYKSFLDQDLSEERKEILEMFGGEKSFVDAHRKVVRREFIRDSLDRKTISDNEAIEVAKIAFGDDLSDRHALLNNASRKSLIRFFLDKGLTFNQIARITGFSIEMLKKSLR